MIRSKAYTLNRLIAEVKSLNSREVTDFTTLANVLSPRAGVTSTKIQALSAFLNGNLKSVINSAKYGGNVKTRVLKALRARKNHGSF